MQPGPLPGRLGWGRLHLHPQASQPGSQARAGSLPYSCPDTGVPGPCTTRQRHTSMVGPGSLRPTPGVRGCGGGWPWGSRAGAPAEGWRDSGTNAWGPTSHLPRPSTSPSPTLAARWRLPPPEAPSSRDQDGTEPVAQGQLHSKFWVVKAAYVTPRDSAPHPLAGASLLAPNTAHVEPPPVSCSSHREYLLSWLFPKWVTDSRGGFHQPGRFGGAPSWGWWPVPQSRPPSPTLRDAEPRSEKLLGWASPKARGSCRHTSGKFLRVLLYFWERSDPPRITE